MPRTSRRSLPLPGQSALIDMADLPAGTVHHESDHLAEWSEAAAEAVLAYAATVASFTAYDVVIATGIGEPPHPNHWGSLFTRLRAEGLIEPVGWTHSLRKTSASSGVRRWRARPSARTPESPQL